MDASYRSPIEDYDGDVDFWLANRSGPQVRYLQNNLNPQTTGERDEKHATHFVAFRLQGVDCNRDAIGARVTIEIEDAGKQQAPISNTLRAGEGYLSQSSKWLHFGLGSSTRDLKSHDSMAWQPTTDIRESLGRPLVHRATRRANRKPGSHPRTLKPLTPSNFTAPGVSDKARIVLLAPIPLPSAAMHGQKRPPEAANSQRKWPSISQSVGQLVSALPQGTDSVEATRGRFFDCRIGNYTAQCRRGRGSIEGSTQADPAARFAL